MALSRIRLFYIIAVLISGIAVGLLILQQPHLQQAAVPPATELRAAVAVRTARLIDNVLLDLSSNELEKGRADPTNASAAASVQLSIGVF
jgi:hypothetical protein